MHDVLGWLILKHRVIVLAFKRASKQVGCRDKPSWFFIQLYGQSVVPGSACNIYRYIHVGGSYPQSYSIDGCG